MKATEDAQSGERIIKYLMDEIAFSEVDVQMLSREIGDDLRGIQGVINLMYKDTEPNRRNKKRLDVYISDMRWGIQKLITHLGSIERRSEDMRMSIERINEKLSKMEEST